MATKTLLRTGTSMATRLLNSALTQSSSPSSTHQSSSILLSSSRLFLSPSLRNDPVSFPDSPLSFPFGQEKKVEDDDDDDDNNNNNALEIVKNFYPFGHPSLDFFLPDANDSSDEHMILFPKRTFQPSTLRRKRNHGFFARKATKGGRRVIVRRIAKGRHRITA